MSTPSARSIFDVSAPYANFMLNPPPAGPGVCRTCATFVEVGYRECYRCAQQRSIADAVVPITLSVGGEQMHHSLRQYKDGIKRSVRDRFTGDLAAVVWRFLLGHERCLAHASGVDEFSRVAVVPSTTTERDSQRNRLRHLAGRMVEPTAGRFERLLEPTDSPTLEHTFDVSRYRAVRPLQGETVLLIDDTWTTGSSMQAAEGCGCRSGRRNGDWSPSQP